MNTIPMKRSRGTGKEENQINLSEQKPFFGLSVITWDCQLKVTPVRHQVGDPGQGDVANGPGELQPDPDDHAPAAADDLHGWKQEDKWGRVSRGRF